MAGAFQGFVRNRNLQENPVDRNALNNLGVSPIGDDIALFKNNRRNVSIINVTILNINTITDKIFFTDRNAVFSNGTRVSHNGVVFYYIKNSNGQNEFQLSNDPGLVTTVQLDSNFVGSYTRSDEVTFENVTNYTKRRRPAITNVPLDIGTTIVNYESNVNENIEGSDTISGFEDYVNNFKNLKNNSLIKNKNFTTDIDFLSYGHLKITDPDGFNDLNLTANSGPGIFIYNPVEGTKIRAFSDTQNVWQPNVANTYLETTARKITTGVLTVRANTVTIEQKPASTENIVIQTATPTNITTSGATPSFTHKVKVFVNGEEFFLCLGNTATIP